MWKFLTNAVWGGPVCPSIWPSGASRSWSPTHSLLPKSNAEGLWLLKDWHLFLIRKYKLSAAPNHSTVAPTQNSGLTSPLKLLVLGLVLVSVFTRLIKIIGPKYILKLLQFSLLWFCKSLLHRILQWRMLFSEHKWGYPCIFIILLRAPVQTHQNTPFSPRPSLNSLFLQRSQATRFRWHQPAPFDKQQTWAIDNVYIGDGCIDMCSGHGRCIQGNCV